MNDLNSVFVTNILPTGTAFGVRSDNGESVFIPSAASRAVGLQQGQTVECKLLPNAREPEKTPWFAFKIHNSNDDDDAEVIEPELTVWDIVKDGGVWSVRSVFAELYEGPVDANCPEYAAVSNELARLHRTGDLSIAKFYRRPDQKAASSVLYSTDIRNLFPGGSK